MKTFAESLRYLLPDLEDDQAARVLEAHHFVPIGRQRGPAAVPAEELKRERADLDGTLETFLLFGLALPRLRRTGRPSACAASVFPSGVSFSWSHRTVTASSPERAHPPNRHRCAARPIASEMRPR